MVHQPAAAGDDVHLDFIRLGGKQIQYSNT
jgi:hypothetical protein